MQKLQKFNRTELEEIPEGWEIRILEDISEKISVGIATSTTKYFAETGVPLLRNQNIKEGYIDTCDLTYITKEFSKLNSSRALKEGDVICVRTGNPGQSAVVTSDMNGWQTFTTLIIRPLKDKIDSYYLSRFLNSITKTKIKSVQAGGSQQNLNAGWLSKIYVKLPPLKEQQKITSILSKVDELIQKTQQIIEQTQRLKKGLMQNLMNSGKNKFKTYTIMEIGENFGDAPFGSQLKTKDYVSFGIPVIQGRNIQDNRFEWNDKLYISKEKFESIPRSHCNTGDLIFPKIGTIGKIAILPVVEGYKTCILSTNTMKMSVNPKKANKLYVYYYFCQDNIKKYIIDNSHGSSQPIFNFTTLKNFKILLPPIDKQNRICLILQNMDSSIQNQIKYRNLLKSLKKGLMQQLLTGKIRVKV